MLVNKGFNIHDELVIIGATLKIPAFTKGKDQLSQSDVENTRQLACVKIHVSTSLDS